MGKTVVEIKCPECATITARPLRWHNQKGSRCKKCQYQFDPGQTTYIVKEAPRCPS